MAAGLPVAVSDVGGPRELVKDRAMGRVLRARDAGIWTAGLAEMLAHLPNRAERLALSGQASGERRWDEAFAKFWASGA